MPPGGEELYWQGVLKVCHATLSNQSNGRPIFCLILMTSNCV